MNSIHAESQYILQEQYTSQVYLRYRKYILERVIGNSFQKGDSLSEKCNKFERKIPTFVHFMLLSVLQKRYLVNGLDCNKNLLHKFSY